MKDEADRKEQERLESMGKWKSFCGRSKCFSIEKTADLCYDEFKEEW